MRVCVVGSGGREHALALALVRSPSVEDVVVCPGNHGMVHLALGAAEVRGGDRVVGGALGAAPKLRCADVDPAAVDADLWVIGPEALLVAGLADRLRAGGRLVLGPGADGARLEGSKAWMKRLLSDAGVPTAAHATFAGTDELPAALAYLRSLPPPWVVKTDGLASGKGVLVTDELSRAEADLAAKLSGAAFGGAGRRVVIEEGLDGVELSVMALCDGRVAVPLAPARDHKRLGDGDVGPNTGGMGAYSPVPGASDAVIAEVMDRCVEPTLDALRGRGVDYRGVLYAGLMLTAAGPRVIEFNVRFGDPETQVVLPRLDGDLAALLAGAARGDLGAVAPPRSSETAAAHVVLAAGGYPEAPRTGERIDPARLAAALAVEGVEVISAGVAPAGGRGSAVDRSPGAGAGALGGIGSAGGPCGIAVSGGTRGAEASSGGPGGELVTSGGRVLGLTGTGPTLAVARERAYAAVEVAAWPGCLYRRDIASRSPEPTGE